MRRRLVPAVTLVVAIAALAAVPTVFAGKHGRVVAKDTDSHGKSKVAVATASLKTPGKLTFKVTTRPAHVKVAWDYTNRCIQDGRLFQHPLPGHAHDTFSRTPFAKHMKNGGARHPDSCDVAVSAKLKYKVGKAVTVKILEK